LERKKKLTKNFRTNLLAAVGGDDRVNSVGKKKKKVPIESSGCLCMFAHGCSLFFSKRGWIRIWELGAWDREPFFFVHAAKKSRLIITLFTKLVGGGTEARDAATAPPFALLPRPAAAP
jgi:hypothetical protein